MKQQPKLRVTHKLRGGEVFTSGCAGGIIVAQAIAKEGRGGGGTISLKTVARAALNLQIAAPRFVQARYIMMTILSSQVTSPNATPHAMRHYSTTTLTKREMATMISWVKLHAALNIVANLKNLASRRLDLAALAAGAIPAMTLAVAVTTRASPAAASARAPNVSREDASTIHASLRSARRVKKKSSSLRRRRAAVKALTAPQLNPPNQSALLLLRLLKRSLRRRW